MPDAPATNDAQQGGRREGSALWGMVQVCDQPQCACAGKLMWACMIASPADMGDHAIRCVWDYDIITRG